MITLNLVNVIHTSNNNIATYVLHIPRVMMHYEREKKYNEKIIIDKCGMFFKH